MTITGSGFALRDVRGPVRNTITYAAGTTGLQGAITNIFTVTGEIIVVYLIPYCTTSLTEDAGTPTLQLGVTGASNVHVAATTATNILTTKFWFDTSPSSNEAVPATLKDFAIRANIVCEVAATNNIDAGVIEYTLLWIPVSTDGNAVAA